MAKKINPPQGGWLFKEEPDHYNFADLERDGTTWWDGVTNALARQHLRKVKKGDRVLYYHTAKQRAIVGEMRVLAGAQADPESDDPKAVRVQVGAARRWDEPLTRDRMKKDPRLASWELIRQSRLSVLPVSPDQWRILQELACPMSG